MRELTQKGRTLCDCLCALYFTSRQKAMSATILTHPTLTWVRITSDSSINPGTAIAPNAFNATGIG